MRGRAAPHARHVSWRVFPFAPPTRSRIRSGRLPRKRTGTEYLSGVKCANWPEAARCEERRKGVGRSFPALAPPTAHPHWSDRPLLFRVSKQRVWDALTGPDFTSPHLCRSRGRRASRLSRTATPDAPRPPLFCEFTHLVLSPSETHGNFFFLFPGWVRRCWRGGSRSVVGGLCWAKKSRRWRCVFFFFTFLGRASGVL